MQEQGQYYFLQILAQLQIEAADWLVKDIYALDENPDIKLLLIGRNPQLF